VERRGLRQPARHRRRQRTHVALFHSKFAHSEWTSDAQQTAQNPIIFAPCRHIAIQSRSAACRLAQCLSTVVYGCHLVVASCPSVHCIRVAQQHQCIHHCTLHRMILHVLSVQSMEDRQAYVKDMHLQKTELFMKLIEKGQLPLRPGVQRIIGMHSKQCKLL